jgi:cell division protein FtsA
MALKTDFSVVIDFGTSKLTALAGRQNDGGKIELLAAAKVPARGIKRGVIFNIDEAAACVTQLLNELKPKLEEDIQKVNVSYAGQPMKVIDFKLGRYTTGEGIVTQQDVDGLLKEVHELQVEPGYVILHVIPQAYIVDEEIIDLSPAGITGRKIEGEYKIVLVPESYVQNFRRVLEKAGVEVGEIMLSPLVTGEAVLTDDEKELGAIMLDIGAGTTKMAVYHEGSLIHMAVIPFGGEVVTHDIKEGCSILQKWAEQLKIQYGQALGDFADERKVVTIPGHSGWEPKEISFKSLAFIIQARMEEIIDGVNFQIEKSGIGDQLGSGIVVSGGTSGLNNLVSLIKFRTGLDARIAYPVCKLVNQPKNFENKDYLTALGLLKLTFQTSEPEVTSSRNKERKKKENKIGPWFKGVVQGVLDYMDDDEDVVIK